MESGQTKVASFAVGLKLAQALDVSPWLLALGSQTESSPSNNPIEVRLAAIEAELKQLKSPGTTQEKNVEYSRNALDLKNNDANAIAKQIASSSLSEKTKKMLDELFLKSEEESELPVAQRLAAALIQALEEIESRADLSDRTRVAAGVTIQGIVDELKRDPGALPECLEALERGAQSLQSSHAA